ncbi:MAG: permease-like cell division protein FtsX [Pseudomonadota bacterium]|nr:permease-like cell division protein FtsX [Pseudomonadota bacterium]
MKRLQRSVSEKQYSKTKPLSYGRVWLTHHTQSFVSSLIQLLATPLPSLMTVAVIGIALALPTGLYLLLENIQAMSGDWDNTVQISLFLKKNVDNAQAHVLADQLRQRTDIENVQVITPQQALEEYRLFSGFGEALTALPENPLPAVLVLQLASDTLDPKASEQLAQALNALPEVDIAQLDMRWLKRLLAIIELIQRGVLILAILLSLTVLLVVGNTIRLAIYNRRQEIEINKLVGATDAFIRRPFLYSGFWYGFGGSLIAWLLVNLALWLLQAPVEQLKILYYSQFELMTLTFWASLILFTSGSLLGLIGAGLAVERHLKEIQPR